MFIKQKQIKIQKVKSKTGVTIIEALVVLFIFALITVTFYSVFSVGIRYIQEAKNRLGATALLNEKMEIIHNLEYDKIGIPGGMPPGVIPANEDELANGKNFHIATGVKFGDDDFDRKAPGDTIPTDYKIVKVIVSWDSGGSVYATARFVPPGVESAYGGGVLEISVIDSLGAGVANSTVKIVNNETDPTVNMTSTTGASGKLIFPGAAESIQKYQITVEKDAYETVATVDPATIIDYIPVDANASVVSGLVNTKVIVQNKVSNLEIKTVDANDGLIADVGFDIAGGRVLGTKLVSPFASVYNFDKSGEQTNSSGEKKYESISPGQYAISNVSSVSGYTLIGFEPQLPLALLADESRTVKIKFANNDVDSLLVKISRSDDGSPLNGASARLFGGAGYDSTQLTLEDGVVFFQAPAGSYTLEVEADGFANYSNSFDIDKLINKNVSLVSE